MKVGVIGAQGSGKTTLLNALSHRLADLGYEVAVLHEAARLCPYELNREGSEEGQAWIFAKQLMMEAESAGFQIVLVDRTPLDQLAYIDALVKRERASKDFAGRYIGMSMFWMPTYDVLLYLPPEIAPQDDGVRDPDVGYQKEIDDTIRAYMVLFMTKPEVISGPLERRVESAQRAIVRHIHDRQGR